MKYIIGQFNECFPPIMDGVSLTVRNYALWLNRMMGDTYMVTPAYPGYADREEFPVLRYASAPVPGRPPYRAGFPWLDAKLNKQLRHIPFNLLHCHSPFSAGRHALWLARRRGIPVVATFHSKYREDFARAVGNPALVKMMLQRVVEFYTAVDEVWIPQPAVEETLREYGYRGKLTVVENGTDFVQDEMNAVAMRRLSRKRIGHEEDETIFLFVGQMILEKNLKLILETLGALHEMNFTAYFVGQGYAAQQLELLSARLGIAEKVHFTGTIHDRQLLMHYYAAADLFLFPSLYDNAPLVVREAAAMSTPSLLVEGATAAEIICDGVNGFLTQNSKEALAAKIRQILNNRQLLKNVGHIASKTVANSWEHIIGTVQQRYVGLMRNN